MDERDRMIDRVRKVLAMTESPNEGEARIAMEMAHRMLKEYNLSMSDLEVERAEVLESTYYIANRIVLWRERLFAAVLRTNYCDYVVRIRREYDPTARRNDSIRRLTMIGRADNIEAARAMLDYLYEVVERLTKPITGNDAKKSFRLGLVDTLIKRLYAMRKQDSEETGTALVLREDAKVKQYLANLGVTETDRKATEITDPLAYIQGRTVGHTVALNKQVKGEA